MSTTPPPDPVQGYDYSGLPVAATRGSVGTTSSLTGVLLLVAMAVGGLVVATVGAITAAFGAREVAKASTVDLTLVTPAQAPDLPNLVVQELGRTLEFVGAGLVVAAIGLAVWTVLRTRTAAPPASAGP